MRTLRSVPGNARYSLPGHLSHPGSDPSRPEDPRSAAASPGSLHRLPGRDPVWPSDVGPGDGPPVFPAALFRQAHSVLVYGRSMPLVRLTLFALASSANPRFHWVEFAPSSVERTPCDPVRLGWIPDDRLWLIDPSEGLRPDDAGADLPISKLISPDEPAQSLRQFAEFLRLPNLSQQIIASQPPTGQPGVVAVTNVQHAVDAFPIERVAPILSVHRDSGFSVMVGHDDTPGPGWQLFDFVFRIQGDGQQLRGWKEHQLVCEKGITSGPLRNRQPVRLDEIPLLDAVLSKARPAES